MKIIYSCYIRQPMYLSFVYFNRPLDCVTLGSVESVGDG